MNANSEEIKASQLLKDAAGKAALLLTDAAEKAARLPIDAAEKAARLPIDAAEKAARLPIVAAQKAVILLKNAAEKASQLPKESTQIMTDLLNDAAIQAAQIFKEESEKLTSIKNTFLDIAAHELRNPITAASLLLMVVEKQIEKGQAPDLNMLAKLRKPIDRLSKLVLDLLDMSRLERGLFVLTPVQTDIVSLISECLDEFRVIASDRSFVFNRPEQPIEIILDPIRINQVLTNLLDNAVKYSSKGTIEVTLLNLPDLVRVSITDHGVGIPKDLQEVLFKAISRGISDTNAAAGGMGLGLSICRAIIELHKGNIGVISEKGQGATFYFELPKNITKQ